MVLIASLIVIIAIVALFDVAAQAWGADSRQDTNDTNAPRAGIR